MEFRRNRINSIMPRIRKEKILPISHEKYSALLNNYNYLKQKLQVIEDKSQREINEINNRFKLEINKNERKSTQTINKYKEK